MLLSKIILTGATVAILFSSITAQATLRTKSLEISGDISPAETGVLHNNAGKLTNVLNETASLYITQDCGWFSCSGSEALLIKTPSQTYNLGLTETQYSQLEWQNYPIAILQFAKKPLVMTTPSKNYQITVTASVKETKSAFKFTEIAESCQSYCTSESIECDGSLDKYDRCPAQSQKTVCNNYEEHCTPAREVCYKDDTTTLTMIISILNLKENKSAAKFESKNMDSVDRNQVAMKNCFQ